VLRESCGPIGASLGFMFVQWLAHVGDLFRVSKVQKPACRPVNSIPFPNLSINQRSHLSNSTLSSPNNAHHHPLPLGLDTRLLHKRSAHPPRAGNRMHSRDPSSRMHDGNHNGIARRLRQNRRRREMLSDV
jgi:hypothetical protein